MRSTRAEYRRVWEDRLAGPMFLFSMIFLSLLAGVIHRGPELAAAEGASGETQLLGFLLPALVAIWPVFVLEAILRFFLRDRPGRTWKRAGSAVAMMAIPPLRLAARSVTRPGEPMWLPGMGWQEVDYDLQKTLERAFSGPMIFMALMILPVLVVEYFWSEAIVRIPALGVVLEISVAVIWIAFATEFTIRISAAEKKFAYAVNHWIDLAVVVLPTLAFLPFLRVLRVARLARMDALARMAKYYRLYGLAGRSWRGLVLLQVIRHLFNRSPQARLSRLRNHLEGKQDEIRELEREIDYYRRRIEKLQQEQDQR